MIKKSDKDLMNFISYLLSSHSLWFWFIFTSSSLITVILTFLRDSRFSILRIILGSFFIFIFPGLALYKLIFTLKPDDIIDIFFSSLALSVTFIPLFGYLTFITFGPLSFFSSLSIIFVFTILISIAGVYKEYRTIRLAQPE